MNHFDTNTHLEKQRENSSDSYLSNSYLEDSTFSRGEALEGIRLFQHELFSPQRENSLDTSEMPHNLKALIRPLSKPILEAMATNLNEVFSFEITLPSMESIFVKAKITPQLANIVMCVSSQKLRSTLQKNEKTMKASLKKSLNKEVNISIENDD
jgi:hypothetical protein